MGSEGGVGGEVTGGEEDEEGGEAAEGARRAAQGSSLSAAEFECSTLNASPLAQATRSQVWYLREPCRSEDRLEHTTSCEQHFWDDIGLFSPLAQATRSQV